MPKELWASKLPTVIHLYKYFKYHVSQISKSFRGKKIAKIWYTFEKKSVISTKIWHRYFYNKMHAYTKFCLVINFNSWVTISKYFCETTWQKDIILEIMKVVLLKYIKKTLANRTWLIQDVLKCKIPSKTESQKKLRKQYFLHIEENNKR